MRKILLVIIALLGGYISVDAQVMRTEELEEYAKEKYGDKWTEAAENLVIIAEGYVSDIAGHMGGMNAYGISIRPIIKVDIKDKKIRITYTVQYYDVIKSSGGGIMGAIGGAIPTNRSEKWALDSCYPFVEKDQHKAKKTSSKALVMTHAYSNVIMDKIEEAVKNGIVGNENDNW